MRNLNAKQKSILTRYGRQGVTNADELPPDVYAELERINDHETLYQNVDCFLMDIYFEENARAV